MHDVDGHTRHLGHRDGAMHRFSLGARGPREGVIDGRALALGQRLPHQHVNHRAVLSVHADQCAVLRRLAHRFKDCGVVHHQYAGISHKELEAGYALAHHVVHVFKTRVGQVGDDHMKAIVNAGFALGLLPPRIERGAHLGSAGLDGEVNDCRGSANGRSPGAGLKIVGGVGAAEGHVQMGVCVDATGQQQEAGCIDDCVCGGGWNSPANLLDDRTVDQQIGLSGRVGVDDGPVLNEHFRHGLDL